MPLVGYFLQVKLKACLAIMLVSRSTRSKGRDFYYQAIENELRFVPRKNSMGVYIYRGAEVGLQLVDDAVSKVPARYPARTDCCVYE